MKLSLKSTGYAIEINKKTKEIERINFYDDEGNEKRINFSDFIEQYPEKADKIERGLKHG